MRNYDQDTEIAFRKLLREYLAAMELHTAGHTYYNRITMEYEGEKLTWTAYMGDSSNGSVSSKGEILALCVENAIDAYVRSNRNKLVLLEAPTKPENNDDIPF